VEVEKHAVRQSFARIGHTLRHLPEDKQVYWFLLAFFCYIDGVYTIIELGDCLRHGAWSGHHRSFAGHFL
jgi:Permeases of the major facilitator superfamily